MGSSGRGKSVDTRRERREKVPLRRSRPSISRTQAAVERELDVALLKAWMGMVANLALRTAPDEVKLAFQDAVSLLWAAGERRGGRPRLRREQIPRAEQLLSHELAVEVDGMVEIPCVTEGWQAIEDHRRRGRMGGRGKLSLSSAKAQLSASKKTQQKQGSAVDTQLALKIGIPSESLLGKEKTYTCAASPHVRVSDPPGFTRFWAVVPNKKGKQNALKAWAKYGCEPMADRIIAKVEQLKAEDKHWLEGYIPHPTTWLNSGGWDDEPVRAANVEPPSKWRVTDVCPRCRKVYFEDEGHQCSKELHS